jgi:integrase/recombinase XerD
MTPLRKRFIDMLEAKGFANGTIGIYVAALAKISTFHNKSPLLFTEDDVRAYLLHEMKVEKLKPKTVNLYRCALLTFYRFVAPEITIMKRIERIKIPRTLPVVLSREEVEAMLGTIKNLKHKTVMAVLYSAGLRVSECATLRISDIDSDRMTIRVESGKGKKDRYTVLSRRALDLLRAYYRAYVPKHWLFPGQKQDSHLHRKTVERIVLKAACDAGISKLIHTHTLRHSFATHLLEAGVQLQVIQQFLGHAHVKTTTMYTQVTSVMLKSTKSPLDMAIAPAEEVANA